MLGARWEVEMWKKCTVLWREAHFEVKMYGAPHDRATFGHWSVILCGRHKGFCTLSKVRETWKFCSISRNDGRRGTFQEDLQRCISRGRHSTRDMFIRDVRRSGCWFPEMSCILAHQIFRFAKVILRDRCNTLYELASLFRGRRSTLDRWSGNLFLMVSTWQLRKSRRILSFFWRCKVQTLRKSRRIAAFLILSSSILRKSPRIASFSRLQKTLHYTTLHYYNCNTNRNANANANVQMHMFKCTCSNAHANTNATLQLQLQPQL